ncbi:hypothetical protein SSBR45G_05080 [Bradyrhizobium sp. SSBR45G]|nr:hypothetical protein SSBR45G_05080 [Bradyrhizobium sp. SSBR45G]GLH82610.1 hypothetical protein SSBR45R_00700 [Bradyrhizobium sp. SSBR45R]
MLEVGQCPVVTIKKEDDRISVGAELYDSMGRLIATIKNNEFQALSGRAQISRDNDLSKLIIKNGDGDEILFVHFINRTSVKVRGVFGCPGHPLVRVADGRPLPNFSMSGCVNLTKGAKIRALFKVGFVDQSGKAQS